MTWGVLRTFRRVAPGMNTSISVGAQVRVKLQPGCAGGDRPHDPGEDGEDGQLTGDSGRDDHPLFVLFRGHGPKVGGIGLRILGRHFAADELESISTPPS